MKNVFLSVVIICALAIAGVGGTLANFSDTEEVFDNVFESGSLDLMVWNGSEWVDQKPWGIGASGLVNVTCAAPEGEYPTIIYVANFGDCVSGELWMAFKNFRCYNVNPSHEQSGYWIKDVADEPNWKLKPEPELVAEYGGHIEQEYVDGIGPWGDECSWTKALEVAVSFDGVTVKDWTLLFNLIDPAKPNYIYLGVLESCGAQHEVKVWLRFADKEDPVWEIRGINEMFKDWPTNVYMLDGTKFDILFGLVQDTDG